jgi:hypothetical protein
MSGYVPFDPNKPLQAPTPADASPASTKSGAYVPFNPNAATTTSATPTDDKTAQPAQPSGWGIDWSKGGQVTMPQSVQDFGDIAGNEAMMGTLPSLKAQADAARQRLGPAASAGADVTGNVLSPTTLLSAFGGPVLAGAAHEGIKSLAAGNPWSTIADDAAMGAISGGVGGQAAKLAPAVLPQLTKAAVDLGPAAAMTTAAHKVFGEPSKDILTALGGYALTRNMSEGAGEFAKGLAESPIAQQAIKSLILGGSSAFRQGAGPWDQWVPGQ